MKTVIQRGDLEATWDLGDVEQKLALRGALPGASIWDDVQRALASLDVDARLSCALPASWMVNNKVTSPALAAWNKGDGQKVWRALVRADDDARRTELVTALCDVQSPRLPLAAVSKVWALLDPARVPLLDDAAIAFLCEAIDDPASDTSSAGPEHLTASLSAFKRACDDVDLDPRAFDLAHKAQVIDRLLWFDSYGHRLFPGWTRVTSSKRVLVAKS